MSRHRKRSINENIHPYTGRYCLFSRSGEQTGHVTVMGHMTEMGSLRYGRGPRLGLIGGLSCGREESDGDWLSGLNGVLCESVTPNYERLLIRLSYKRDYIWNLETTTHIGDCHLAILVYFKFVIIHVYWCMAWPLHSQVVINIFCI